MHFLFLAVERRSDKHPHAHQSGIGNLDAHLGRAKRGIQNRADVANVAEEDFVGVRIQPNFRGLAYVHARQIVLKNVAENPDLAQVGNRKRVGSAEASHAGGVGNLLVGNDAGNRSDDVDDRRRVIDAAPQHAKLLRGVLDVNFGFVLHVLRGLIVVQRNRSPVVQEPGTFVLDARKFFVRYGLAIIGKGGGDVGALHAEQHLPFLDRVSEARLDFHHAAGGNGDDRNVSRDIRIDRPGHGQLDSGKMLDDPRQRELFGTVDLKDVGLLGVLDHRRRRRFCLGVAFRIAASGNQQASAGEEGGLGKTQASHGITSRPTASFN